MYGLLFGAAGITTMLIPLHEQPGTLAPMYFIVAALAAWLEVRCPHLQPESL